MGAPIVQFRCEQQKMRNTDRITYQIFRLLAISMAFVVSLRSQCSANVYEDLNLKASNELIDMAEGNMRSDTLWQTSIVALNIVASRYSKKSDKTTRRDAVVAMRHLGNLYITYDVDYNKAYKYLHTACQIAEEDSDIYDLAFIYNNLANIYHWGMVSTDDKKIWVEYLTKAANAASESKNQEAMIPIALNIINVAAEDSTLWRHYHSQIDKISKFSFSGKYSLEGKLARTLIQGWTFFMEGDTRGAEANFTEARKVSLDSDLDATYAYSIDILMSEILDVGGDFDKCLAILKSLAAESRKTDNKDYELSAYRRIAHIYKKNGVVDSASLYEKRYADLRSVFEKRAGFRDVGVLNFLSEIEKTEAAAEQQEDTSTQGKGLGSALGYVISFVVILLALVVSLLWSHKRRSAKDIPAQPQQEDPCNVTDESEEQLDDDFEEENVLESNSDSGKEDSEEELATAYSRIISIMNTSEDIYKPGYSLSELAATLQLPRRIVSKAINNCHGSNFHQFLNEYRIKKVLELIDNGHASNFTIESLAQSVGFKSRPSFVTLFKKKVGVSPSEYIRNSEKN